MCIQTNNRTILSQGHGQRKPSWRTLYISSTLTPLLLSSSSASEAPGACERREPAPAGFSSVRRALELRGAPCVGGTAEGGARAPRARQEKAIRRAGSRCGRTARAPPEAPRAMPLRAPPLIAMSTGRVEHTGAQGKQAAWQRFATRAPWQPGAYPRVSVSSQ